MSGGRYGYKESEMCKELYGYPCELPRHRDSEKRKGEYESNYKRAVKENPFHDAELSGLMFDMLYMVHALDFYDCGDTSKDTYKKDVAWFKQKWLKSNKGERIKEIADILYQNARERIEQAIDNYEVKTNEQA